MTAYKLFLLVMFASVLYSMEQTVLLPEQATVERLLNKIDQICSNLEFQAGESFMDFDQEAADAAANALVQYYRDRKQVRQGSYNKPKINMHTNISGFRTALRYYGMQEVNLLKRRCEQTNEECLQSLVREVDLLEEALTPLFKGNQS